MGNKDFILDLFNRLSKNDIYQGGYSEDKESIRKIFKNTNKKSTPYRVDYNYLLT
jgi:hypothetical protein